MKALRTAAKAKALGKARTKVKVLIAAPEPEPEAQGDVSGDGDIVARPDGYHWIAPDNKQEFGPFETLAAARAYRDAAADAQAAPVDALQEAEAEIGIADWIDPDTGKPAEGPCPPHLERE